MSRTATPVLPSQAAQASVQAGSLPTTWDCTPGLDDAGVLDFARTGVLMLPGVVPEEINRRTSAFMELHDKSEPSEILREPWFLEHVILNPAAAGAVRSLLGAGFGLPVMMSSHRRRGPTRTAQGWHVDGGSRWRPEIQDLQVFYYPQETPEALGPTHVLPGSHLIEHSQRGMAHYGSLRGERSTAAPAGTIFITMYRIWHRASGASSTATRDLLKYCYFRLTEPRRDWPRTPGFELATANYAGPAAPFGDQFHECIATAELFSWLCGEHQNFHHVGGQAWPLPASRIDRPYGVPPFTSSA